MHRTGHIGVGLLLYAPIAYVLFATDQPMLALLGGIGLVVLEPLPDADLDVPLLSHRGVSHTLLAAGLVGIAVGILSWFAADGAIEITADYLRERGFRDLARASSATGERVDGAVLGAYGFMIGAGAILAHLAADVLTPMGLRPFWPISSRSVSLDLTRAANPIANGLLFVLGVLVAASALWFGLVTG